MLARIAELAGQSNMSRNAFIESVIAEYVQTETTELNFLQALILQNRGLFFFL
jgi:predicted transcriptional regulator